MNLNLLLVIMAGSIDLHGDGRLQEGNGKNP